MHVNIAWSIRILFELYKSLVKIQIGNLQDVFKEKGQSWTFKKEYFEELQDNIVFWFKTLEK